MNSRERIAYLRGLLDFMPREEKETKIYAAIVEALDSLASELEEQAKLFKSLMEEHESLEDDLYELHDAVCGLEESLGLEDDDDYEDEAEDEEELAESYASVTCTPCNYSFYYRCEEGKEGESLVCPACGEEINRTDR